MISRKNLMESTFFGLPPETLEAFSTCSNYASLLSQRVFSPLEHLQVRPCVHKLIGRDLGEAEYYLSPSRQIVGRQTQAKNPEPEGAKRRRRNRSHTIMGNICSIVFMISRCRS